MAFTFSLFTQNVLLSIEDIVPPSNVIVEYEYEYSKKIQTSGGNCFVKDTHKTKKINESFVTQYQLEEMSAE